MNLSEILLTKDNNFQKTKKSNPISINSNPFPFQFIINNKKHNLAISYITMGNQIQKIQKNKNSNILSVSKKNTAQTLGNKNMISESHISKYSVNSLISKSSFTNQNCNTQLKISNYKIVNKNNNKSDYSSFLFKSKKTKKNDEKKSANISINNIIKSNSILKENSKIYNKLNSKSNIRNCNLKNTKDFIINNFHTLNNNILNEKEIKNIELTLNNGKNKNKKKIIKNNKNYLFNPFQKKITNNVKKENKILVSSFINNNIKNKKNNNKLNKTNNTNNKKIISKASTQCKTNNTITSSNKNNVNSNFRNIRNKTISINLNKILKDIQIEKKNYKSIIKRNQINLNNQNTTSLLEIIEKNIEKESSHKLITENNEEKEENSLDSFLSILKDKKNIINNNNHHHNNKSYINNLFDENNLYEIPENYDDKFDNLHSIVKKIPFNKVLINCGNFFSLTNKRYDTYINEFIQNYSN